jgi:hypothetical protein
LHSFLPVSIPAFDEIIMSYRPGTVPPARQSALVFTTAQQLRQEPGPSVAERYAYVLELGAMFAWTLYDGSDDDGIDVIAPSGGPGTGTWIRTRSDDRGDDLTNADATILVSGNRTRVLPAATLTANHTLTLDDEGAVEGDELFIVRNDATAYTYTIVNGGAGAGNVAVMPVSNRAWCHARFDGTNWIHLGSGIALASS